MIPTPAAPAVSVLIVSGLKREAAILSGPGRLAICGDGPTLRARLAKLADTPIDLVVSWGVCGGLDPRLRPGDLILGSDVVSSEGGVGADEAVASSLARRLTDAGARVTVERVAAVSSPVSTARAKADLRIADRSGGGRHGKPDRRPFRRSNGGRPSPFCARSPIRRNATCRRSCLTLSTPTAGSRPPPSSGSSSALPASSPGSSRRLATAGPRSGALSRCRGLLPGLFLGLGPANL